jgi:hypothetical protein
LIKRICVFCGSNPGNNPEYVKAAHALGECIAKSGAELVYGGGNVGIMGEIANAVLAGGGRAIGVIPKTLVDKELAHRSLTELRVVNTMHERKALMSELSDAFIALPGGIGTLEEFFEVLTWAQLGFQKKPCGLLNIAGYYDHLIAFIDKMVSEGFLNESHRELMVIEKDPDAIIEKLKSHKPVFTDKWLNEFNLNRNDY